MDLSDSCPDVNPVYYNNDQHGKVGHRYNRGMNIMGGTSHFLVGFKNHSTGENTYLVLQIWPKTCGWETHRSQKWTCYYYFAK